jgi:prepilin-type N-terminal cleavage/methylation domain-containing protein
MNFHMQDASQDMKTEKGFTLIEMLIAILILGISFMAFAGSIPLAALIHRGALEKEQAVSLAQAQMEFFLTNPGPATGTTGTNGNFFNSASFPSGYSGSFRAETLAGTTQIIITVTVTPPHSSRIQFCAIDTQ